MAELKCTPCIEKKVAELIANSQGRFTDEDKEWLQALDEKQLDKMSPIVKEVEKIVEVNVLTDAQKAALAFGEKQLKERREGWVKGIQANTDKVWSDEKLNKMDDDTLEGIYKSVKKDAPVDYSVTSSFVSNDSSGSGGSLYPCGVVMDNKK